MEYTRKCYRKYVPIVVRGCIFHIRMRIKPILYPLWRRLGRLDVIYDTSAFEGFKNSQLRTAPVFVEVMMRHFNPTSVIDIGCGPAGFLAEFRKRGVEISGVDGSTTVLEHLLVPRECVQLHNLVRPLHLNRRYDLCVCMEVAEHLDKRYARILVRSICDASDTVFFTAAVPGQGGMDHANEQPPEYWLALFEENAFEFQPVLTEAIRLDLTKGLDVLYHYIPRNALIFRHE